MITPGQVSFFKTFGFLALRQSFDGAEIAAISQTFDELLDRDRQGQPFSGEKRHALYGMVEQHPRLMKIVEDDRIYETVEQLLGPGFSWFCSEGNLYVGDTEWHPDGGINPDFSFMKVSLYLDPLTADTGCLRVVPGSHRLPFLEDLKNLADRHGAADANHTGTQIDIAGTNVPCYPLETRPGDVFFLNMNLWHASFGGQPGRRHLALNFAPEPTDATHLDRFRKGHQNVLNLMGRFQHTRPGRVFSDTFLESNSPRIQRLVSRWKELELR